MSSAVRPVWLKATAALLTLGTTVASAVYVSAHLKNAGAPLQPAVVAARDNGGGASAASALGSGSGVEPTDGAPVASTYAS